MCRTVVQRLFTQRGRATQGQFREELTFSVACLPLRDVLRCRQSSDFLRGDTSF
jgi:hypothetical protein